MSGLLLMEGDSFALVPRSMLSSAPVRSLTPSGLRVWLALLSHASHESPRPFPSWARLAKVSGLARTQVGAGMASLRSAGLLRSQRRGSTSAVYTLVRPAPDIEVPESGTSEVPQHGMYEVPQRGTQKRPPNETPQHTSPDPSGARVKGAPKGPSSPQRAPRARGAPRPPAGRGGGGSEGPPLPERLRLWAAERAAAAIDDDAARHYPGGPDALLTDTADALVAEWQAEPTAEPWRLVCRDERLTRERDRHARLGAVREAVATLEPSAVVREALGLTGRAARGAR